MEIQYTCEGGFYIVSCKYRYFKKDPLKYRVGGKICKKCNDFIDIDKKKYIVTCSYKENHPN